MRHTTWNSRWGSDMALTLRQNCSAYGHFSMLPKWWGSHLSMYLVIPQLSSIRRLDQLCSPHRTSGTRVRRQKSSLAALRACLSPTSIESTIGWLTVSQNLRSPTLRVKVSLRKFSRIIWFLKILFSFSDLVEGWLISPQRLISRAASFGQLFSPLLAFDRCGCGDMCLFYDETVYWWEHLFAVTPFPPAITL